MKKIKNILLLVLIIFLTGCSSYDMSMKIDEKKRMDLVLTIMSDTDDIDINQYKEKFEKNGFSVEEHNIDNKYGMVISKHFDSIDDISLGKREEEFDLLYFYSNDYSKEIEKKMFNVDKSLDTNRYAANFYVDLSNLDINLENTTVKFNVSLPNSNFSNNANLVSEDGNELTWNITSSGKTDIDFVFELRSYDYIYYAVAVLVILFLVFSIWGNLMGNGEGKSEKKKSDKPLRNDYDVEKKINNITKNAIKKNEKIVNVKQEENKKNLVPEIKDVDVSTVKPNNNIGLMEQFDNTFSVENNNLPNPFGSSNNNEIIDVPVINNNVVENQTVNEEVNDVNMDKDIEDNIDLDNHIDDNFIEEIIKVNNKDVVVNKKKNENRF